MKIFAFIALISSVAAIRMTKDDLSGGWERHVNGDPEDFWIEVGEHLGYPHHSQAGYLSDAQN